MVRRTLEKYYNKKMNLPRVYVGRIGEVSIYRKEDGYRVLISDVSLASGEPIADHLWIRSEVMPQTIGLNIGDTIQFTGVVAMYRKQSGVLDYGISPIPESFMRACATA